jgi:hypothetical protein
MDCQMGNHFTTKRDGGVSMRGHIWSVLAIGWLNCAIGLAQSSFVSEITVPGYNKAELGAFILPRYWPANYMDALLVVDIDSSNKRLLGARFALDGTLIGAKWVGSTWSVSWWPSSLKKTEFLPDGKLLICTTDWFGVIDPENPSSRWAKGGWFHTATVGRDSSGNLVIAVLKWVGSGSPSGWRVLIVNPDGTLLRVFNLPAVSFPDIGNFDGSTMYHAWCCQTSSQILVYDPNGNHFILTSSGGGDFGNKHIVVYAFTAEGTIHWISGIAGDRSDGGCTGGDAIGALSAGDGSILIFSTCYNSIYFYRINTNSGYLVETPVVLFGGDWAIRLYPMQTMNYGSVLGYVSPSGSFGTLFTDWSGWRLQVPHAQLLTMATTTAASPVRRLWALGGSVSREDNPPALLAFIDIDGWAEYPFGFYPCFETLLPATPYPLDAALNRVTTASVESVSDSLTNHDFPIEDARLQVTQRCVVCVPSDGDVDGNGCVDDADLLAVLFNFGSTTPDPRTADVNCDGIVDDADLLIVLFNFGSGCD